MNVCYVFVCVCPNKPLYVCPEYGSHPMMLQIQFMYLSVQFSSVAQSCLTLCTPMACSTPGFPVHHQLPELAQTHVHQVSDGTQSSHPLLFPLLPPSIFPNIRVFSNELFTSGSQSTGVSSSASVFPMNTQDWFPLGWAGNISLQSRGLSRVFSNTTVQKHQFFGAQISL